MTPLLRTCRSALVGLQVLVLSFPIASAQNYGLAAGEPMLPFLNGNVPPAPGVPPGQTIQAVDAFPNLRFDHPVWIGPGPGSNPLFLVERKGLIWAFDKVPSTTTKTLILEVPRLSLASPKLRFLVTKPTPASRQPAESYPPPPTISRPGPSFSGLMSFLPNSLISKSSASILSTPSITYGLMQTTTSQLDTSTATLTIYSN